MKKLLVLVALFTTVYATDAQAQQQGGGDPSAMMTRMKERMKPELIEKTKITDAQADKVIEINFGSMQQMRGLRDLSETDRAKKLEEIQAENTKKYKAIPLTDDQVKAVNDYLAERRKNRMQNGGGNRNGGSNGQ
jgi:Spy/CpxP family protein refolding chaperone